MNKKSILVVVFVALALSLVVLKKQTKVASSSVTVKNDVSIQKRLPKLLDLGSHNCVPCKMMTPILDSLTTEYAGIFDVEFIDVWEKREEGAKYKISSIPTQIFFDDEGRELFRHVGFYSRDDILNKFRELGIEL